jgi:uncharacterized membrane protein YqjE
MPVAMPLTPRRNAATQGRICAGQICTCDAFARASEAGSIARPGASRPAVDDDCSRAPRRGPTAPVGTPCALQLGVAPPNQPSASHALDATPTTELMRQVLEETKELVRIETRLARDELEADVVQLKSVAIFGGVAAVLALLTLSTLVVLLILALGGGALAAGIVAAVLLLAAAVTGGVAYQKLPKPPLARTRERLKSEVTQLKEHIQ